MNILITGGAGFIGSATIRYLIESTTARVVNVDSLTYAGNLESLAGAATSERYAFEQADICDKKRLAQIFRTHQPDAVMHLAAESHVDRSIDGPEAFFQTNVVGTGRLLQTATEYYGALAGERRAAFRFLHISTDEVYGPATRDNPRRESDAFAPRSPYAASKSGGDLMCRAFAETYGMGVIVARPANNVGPYQHPEKAVPLFITSALAGEPLPVYGDGSQERDRLYVEDCARALLLLLEQHLQLLVADEAHIDEDLTDATDSHGEGSGFRVFRVEGSAMVSGRPVWAAGC